jgi:hypothetical protein
VLITLAATQKNVLYFRGRLTSDNKKDMYNDLTTRNQRLGKPDYNFAQASLMFLVAVVVGILLIDGAFLIWWMLSGQTPPSGIYLGCITNWIIGLVI